MVNKIDFNKLVGETASLFYCNSANEFQLGSVVFEVIEDEDDGYRSAMSEVLVVKDNAPKEGFITNVEIVKSNKIDGYNLIDTADGFCWLTFGTDYSDSYYHCFVFSTFVRPPFEERIKSLIK